jgi:hypothetical protein
MLILATVQASTSRAEFPPECQCGPLEHVTSTSTGHQVSENRGHRSAYLENRAQKLTNQTVEDPMNEEPKVLRRVRVYINGFLSDTTDIEMKRIVSRAGGQIV